MDGDDRHISSIFYQLGTSKNSLAIHRALHNFNPRLNFIWTSCHALCCIDAPINGNLLSSPRRVFASLALSKKLNHGIRATYSSGNSANVYHQLQAYSDLGEFVKMYK